MDLHDYMTTRDGNTRHTHQILSSVKRGILERQKHPLALYFLQLDSTGKQITP